MAGPPPRHWGWYSLDPRAADRLVASAGIGPGHLVLDLGAGTGALTGPLLDAGARVVAVELHPGRAGALRRRFSGRDLVVVRCDLARLRLPRQPFRVVANPPWALTDLVVRRLLAPGSRLERADLLLKRPATRRWAEARPAGFVTSAGATVGRRSFRPSPPIDARVLSIARAGPRDPRPGGG